MKRSVCCVLFLLALVPAWAQWDVPVRIEMGGDQDAHRQITGLADPNAPDAAVSHAAARATTMAYAEATGTDALWAELHPVPGGYAPGMAVTIVPVSANHAGATLDLNGLGAMPIVKWGSVPLDSADLQPSVPARLVYDGTRFQLISSTYINCPAGFKPIGSNFCIQETGIGTGNFFTAVNSCAAMNARLCTFSEWVQACRLDPGFVGTLSEAEWVDHAANDGGSAKRVGYGSIGSGDGSPGTAPSCVHGTSTAASGLGGIRCCRNR
jgi:hypothetical protein